MLVDVEVPRPPNVPLLRALWSLLDGIWGLLKGSWGVLVDVEVDAGIDSYFACFKVLQSQA